jgi:hypothetical protein
MLVESLQRLLARLTHFLHLFPPRILPTIAVEGCHDSGRFVVYSDGSKVDAR